MKDWSKVKMYYITHLFNSHHPTTLEDLLAHTWFNDSIPVNFSLLYAWIWSNLLWPSAGWQAMGRCCLSWWQVSRTLLLCSCPADAGWPAVLRLNGNLCLLPRSSSLEQCCLESQRTPTRRLILAASPAPYWSSAGQKQLSPLALSPRGLTQCTGWGWSLDAGTPTDRLPILDYCINLCYFTVQHIISVV